VTDKQRAREALVAVAGLAAGLGAIWLVSNKTGGPDELSSPQNWLLGWSFIGSGLIALRVRPQNRLGWAMVFTGFAWFASLLMLAHDEALFTIGYALQVAYIAGFAYVVVSFPSGRLQTFAERMVIGAAVLLALFIQFGALLFTDSRAIECSVCPSNALEVTRNDALARDLHQFQRGAGVLVLLAAIALLAVRWRRASEAMRRAIAPVLWAGSATLALAAVAVTNEVLGKAWGHEPLRLMLLAFSALPVAILFSFLQRHMARGAVAGLVVELGDPVTALDLRPALGRALRDPSLELAYWFPAESRYVDAEGRPVELPGEEAERLSTIVERNGRPIAALIHDAALEHNTELVDSVCAAAGLTLENERLHAELRARLTELQASRARLVEATAAERRRIERDLHDGTQQRLVSVAMSLGLAESKLPPGTEAMPLVREAREALTLALAELRELSQGIHPSILTERGLPTALDELCRRAALPAMLDVSLERRLPAQVETAVYFVVSEAVTNAVKHSHASELRIGVQLRDGSLVAEVADDGIGGAGGGGGSGIRGMTDRVEALGGTLTVSSPPGRGTTLRVEIPCE
jgi:signal transduction histidine kinase